MDRRELLKLFGIGSVIAPVIGGIASAETHVKLIQEPKVELVAPPAFSPVSESMLHDMGEWDVTVYLRKKQSGQVLRMECSAFVTDVHTEMVDVTSYRSQAGFRELIPGQTDITLRCSGQVQMAQAH